MYAERQGWHLPNAPTSSWAMGKPTDGLSKPGIGFYATSFKLNLPKGYDIPLSFVFDRTTGSNYRVQLFVNGYQFGKYINQIGPQSVFPVPEGILDYSGMNYISMTLWAQDANGAKLPSFTLQSGMVVQSGFGPVTNSPMKGYSLRKGAY
jgi:hypothetical protein